MINIRPISDLKNKYLEIEETVLRENEEVYLTKNGYGSAVVMSIEKYSNIIQESKKKNELNKRKEEIENSNIQYEVHKELFPKVKKIMIDNQE